LKKLRGLHFLPGGTGRYVDTLAKCLIFAKSEEPDEERLRRWFSETFPQVRGDRAVESYIYMVENQFELIKREEGRFVLTENGKKFLETRDSKLLFQIMVDRINGVHDVLQLLAAKPRSLKEVDSALRTRFGWKTHYQTYYRLGWLQSLGYATKIGQVYSLTETGRIAVGAPEAELIKAPEEAAKVKEKAPAIPNHNEIRDMICEIGKFEDKISEIEYPIDNLRLDVAWKRIRAGNPSHAFEVQVGGNFYEALTKLKHAWDKWNSKPFLITTEKYETEATQLLQGSFHEIEHVTKIVNWKNIKELYEAEKKARDLKTEIGVN